LIDHKPRGGGVKNGDGKKEEKVGAAGQKTHTEQLAIRRKRKR
jgi:hypothetical protein